MTDLTPGGARDARLDDTTEMPTPATADAHYDAAHEAHYRALYESGTPTDRGFSSAQPAYRLGHLAAHDPDHVGREFGAVEPELRRRWEAEHRARHGEWDAARPYARDAYGHARSEGGYLRRDAGVIGSAGSAVDPVELARARAGEPSTDHQSPGFIETRDQTTGPTDPRVDPGTGGSTPGIDRRPTDPHATDREAF